MSVGTVRAGAVRSVEWHPFRLPWVSLPTTDGVRDGAIEWKLSASLEEPSFFPTRKRRSIVVF